MHPAAAVVLQSILAAEPSAIDPPFEVARVETTDSPGFSSTIALDSDGEVVAEIVAWSDADGLAHFDVAFPDGLYLSAAIVGEQLEVESDDPDAAAARVQLLSDYLANQDPQASEVGCLIGVISAAGCITGNVIGCMVGGFLISCNCLPLIGDHPPGCK